MDREMTQALQTYDAPGPEAWWTDFFINDHVRFQMALAEESHDSDVETDLFIRLASITPCDHVLDVPCGQGRHAIRLAKFGADVAGVDASPGMIERAKANARDQSVQVSWIHSDMRHVESDPVFDCVICLGGSFGYFGRSGDRSFLSTLLRVLRPGGFLVLDAPSLEVIRAHHEPRHESIFEGMSVVQQRYLDPTSGIARIDVTIDSGFGPSSRSYYQQLYLVDELRAMLAVSGFEVCEVLDASGVPEYRTNTGHVLISARRPGE